LVLLLLLLLSFLYILCFKIKNNGAPKHTIKDIKY